MTIPDLTQDPSDVVQELEPYTVNAVPIETVICEPVRTIALPAKNGGFRNFALTTTQSVMVLSRDPRRKRAVLQVSDTAGASDGAFIGGSQAEALSGNAFLLALPGPGIAAGNVTGGTLEITSMDEVWASANVAACTLSVMNEQWAE